MSPWRLRQIARLINHGALIAYPTDTIWGFGCNPQSAQTVKRLQQLKQRSQKKGLILLSPRLEYLKPYIDNTQFQQYKNQLTSVTEKPVTWLVKSSQNCPGWLTGHSDKIAIRLCSARQLQLLCDTMHSPLVSTSANIATRKPVRNSLQAHKHFHDAVDFIIEGFNTGAQQASEIRDLQTGKILRPHG